MWKRHEEDQPVEPATHTTPSPTAPPKPSPPAAERPMPTEPVAVIGPSVVIRGELNGSENLVIDGRVEGTISLRKHLLTVGPHGQIKAQIAAKSVVVVGKVDGNIVAADRLEIREKGSVEGDVVSPALAIAEGAHFKGSIDMQPSSTPNQERKEKAPEPAEGTPVSASAAAAAPPSRRR